MTSSRIALTLASILSLHVFACAVPEDGTEDTALDVGEDKADGAKAVALRFTPATETWRVWMQCRETITCDVLATADLNTDDFGPYVATYFAENPSATEWVIDGLVEFSLASEAENARGETRGVGHTRHVIRPLADGRYEVTMTVEQTEGPNGLIQYYGSDGKSVMSEFRPNTTVASVVRLHREKLLYPSGDLTVKFAAAWF